MFAKPFNNVVKEAILDATPANIAIHDTHHQIVWTNKAYCTTVRRSLQEIQGKKCYSIWGLAKPCRNCPADIAIKTGKTSENQLASWNQDDWDLSQGSWLAKASPLKDADGSIIGTVEIIFELTGINQTLSEPDPLLYDKRHRAKRFQCLYPATELMQQSASVEAFLPDMVKLIPTGCHNPDITRGKIIFKDKAYVSEPFLETEWKLSAAIIANGKSLGLIEVYRLEAFPQQNEGPFSESKRHTLPDIGLS